MLKSKKAGSKSTVNDVPNVAPKDVSKDAPGGVTVRSGKESEGDFIEVAVRVNVCLAFQSISVGATYKTSCSKIVPPQGAEKSEIVAAIMHAVGIVDEAVGAKVEQVYPALRELAEQVAEDDGKIRRR